MQFRLPQKKLSSISGTYSSSPVANRQEVLGIKRIALNAVDRSKMSVEYARDLLDWRLGFAVAQPYVTAFCADHVLLRLNATTRNGMV